MALFDEEERKVLVGVGIGIGAAMLAREIFPVVGSLGRPLLKAAVKSTLVLYDKGREASARLGETIEDLAAEARVELEASARPAAGAETLMSNDQVN